MDREIPKEVRIKERNKKLVKYGIIGVVSVICIGMLISWMQSSVKKKDLILSTVDKGTIEVSVSASGEIVPAFEEIINSPRATKLLDGFTHHCAAEPLCRKCGYAAVTKRFRK